MIHWWLSAQGGEDWPSSDEHRQPRPPRIPMHSQRRRQQMALDVRQPHQWRMFFTPFRQVDDTGGHDFLNSPTELANSTTADTAD